LNHFIRGIFDGDGCITKNHCYLNLVFTGNIYTLNKIKNVLTSILLVKENKVSPMNGSFKLGWCGKQVNLISGWMYNQSTIYLERKYNLFK
jgi:hypothetical protein